MKKNLFHFVIVILIVGLVVVSFFFKDGTEAMVAIVDSQVTAISYQKPIIVKKIAVVAGQEVKKGDLLVEVNRPDLDLDLERLEAEKRSLTSQKDANTRQLSLEKQLLELKQTIDLGDLLAKIEELNVKQAELRNQSQLLGQFTAKVPKKTLQDSIVFLKINSLKTNKAELTSAFKKEIALLIDRFDEKQLIIDQNLRFLDQEISALKEEYQALFKYASFTGTVGSVDVQLDELVPPYKSLMSIYESKPTLIKAFMNERITYAIEVGDEVWVAAETRKYKVKGLVLEVGSRITGYPAKIEPFQTVKSYGQEVFVKINPDSEFLNGEKVYVYPIEAD